MLFVLLFVSFALAANPKRCTWLCDDPTCDVLLAPRCSDPNCQYNPPCPGYSPMCRTICNTTVINADICPLCETQCDPTPTACGVSSPLCAVPVCGWISQPCELRAPICQQQCELVNCLYSAGAMIGPILGILMILVIF